MAPNMAVIMAVIMAGADGVLLRAIARGALILGVFAVVGTVLVAGSYQLTRERIQANEREALLKRLHQVIPEVSYDNDLFGDVIEVHAPELLGTVRPVTIYRARKDGRVTAAVLTPVAPDGYNGRIELLVGVRPDGRVSGVRVLSHAETPGLGDGIEVERSDWMRGFRGRSLGDPPATRWQVKRDGGVFDQFTGATITPRAVVGAVRRTLEYVAKNEQWLFASAEEPPTEAKKQ
ncbi:MAG: electron transport complex subunit RsxG [Gammaproteobacteria bacterium]|nr:electron transport complex subunit RsxG [Gammaproteobacteria bacterium]